MSHLGLLIHIVISEICRNLLISIIGNTWKHQLQAMVAMAAIVAQNGATGQSLVEQFTTGASLG